MVGGSNYCDFHYGFCSFCARGFAAACDVATFGAINEKVKDKDEANQTVRGASLRELKEFFGAHPEAENYAGLRRIGDPSDGTAVWTRLTNDEDVEKALAKRAGQRRDEEEFRRKDIIENQASPPETREAALPNPLGNVVPTTTRPAPQEQKADASANTLARSNVSTSGTCNNVTCYCTIA